jgi:hypothetical protein
MAQVPSVHSVLLAVLGLVEHLAVVVVGFVLMVAGPALGVTALTPPVGVAIALLGAVLLVAGVFGSIDGIKT